MISTLADMSEDCGYKGPERRWIYRYGDGFIALVKLQRQLFKLKLLALNV